MAASYAYGFAKNHCFSDGNKRVSLAVIDIFLQINFHELIVGEVEATHTIEQLAAGKISEEELSNWIELNSVELSSVSDK